MPKSVMIVDDNELAPAVDGLRGCATPGWPVPNEVADPRRGQRIESWTELAEPMGEERLQ